MSFQIHEVESEEQFKSVWELLADGYEKPFNTFWKILQGETDEEGCSRLWQWHQMESGSHWVAVKDSSGNVVGGAEWVIHNTNPFEKGNQIPPAYWWSDEMKKDITNQVLQIFFGRRPATMSRPHLLLNICCVAQASRRKGVGRMMMDWGCKVADEKGLETFVEATLDGVRLYESSGFVQVEPFLLNAKPSGQFHDRVAAWNKVRSELLPTPYPVVLMWRPKGGKWAEGQKFSWEE